LLNDVLVLHKGLESQDYFYTKLQGGIIVYLELLYVSNGKKKNKKKSGREKLLNVTHTMPRLLPA